MSSIPPTWKPGSAPVAVIMISLNEAHNMKAVLDNLEGWAQEVFLVDSFSSDETVDLALSRGVQVFQRSFDGFGPQWNYAINEMPINAPWTMKLDPDERLTPELKASVEHAIVDCKHDGYLVTIRLWFLGRRLPAALKILRLWKTGICRCSDVSVNEHLLIDGNKMLLDGDLEHHDSPNLHHWLDKQNQYTTAEAAMAFKGDALSVTPRIFGTALEQRMWLKQIYSRIPFRHHLMFIYCYLVQGAWRAGRVGFIWAKLRSEVYRMIDYKTIEMNELGKPYSPPSPTKGKPHPEAIQTEQSNQGLN